MCKHSPCEPRIVNGATVGPSWTICDHVVQFTSENYVKHDVHTLTDIKCLASFLPVDRYTMLSIIAFGFYCTHSRVNPMRCTSEFSISIYFETCLKLELKPQFNIQFIDLSRSSPYILLDDSESMSRKDGWYINVCLLHQNSGRDSSPLDILLHIDLHLP